MARKRQNISPDPVLVRTVGYASIFIFSLALTVMAGASFLRTAPFFRVKEVVVADTIQALDLPGLLKVKGQNIFTVDLSRLEARIRGKYPQLAELRVMRRLPDQIFVMAVKREPFAFALLDGRTCVIDREGFVISQSPAGQVPLPLVRGLRHQKVLSGEQVQDERVRVASQVIALCREDARLAAAALQTVNVEDLERVVCVFEEGAGFDVILDKDNVPARIKMLSDVLSRGGLDLARVKYMDLRFSEPVIGQKKVKP